MRLIDADVLIKRAAMRGHCLRPLVTAYHMCVDVKDIEKAPTIDAVEVVRCKDCKHGEFEEENRMWTCMRRAEYDEHLDIFTGFIDYHNEDHFCSYGERRNENV